MGKTRKQLKISPYQLIIFTVLCWGVVGSLALTRFIINKNLISKRKKMLSSRVKETKKKILQLLFEKEKILKSVAMNPKVQQILQKIEQTPEQKFIDQLEKILQPYASTNNLKNILIIDASGKVLLSLNKKEYRNVNLHDKKYLNTALAQSFKQVLMTFSADTAEFEIDLTLNNPALYTLSPVFDNKKIKNVIVAQIDEKDIYSILQNFLYLGKTGEFELGKKTDNVVEIVAPTRHDPDVAFKRSGKFDEEFVYAMQLALKGQSAHGYSIDYRKKPILASWDYIPNLQLGLVGKIDTDEITSIEILLSFLIIIFFIFAIITTIASSIFYILVLNTNAFQIIKMFLKKNLQKILIFLIIICFIFASYNYIRIKYLRYNLIKKSHELSAKKMKKAAMLLEFSFKKIQSLAKEIKEDLSQNLSAENLIIRLKRDVNENKNILGATVIFNNKAQPFAPYVIKNGTQITSTQLANIIDYTSEDKAVQQNIWWYHNALKHKKGIWSKQTKELLNKENIIIYALPFKLKDGRTGVVAIFYPLKNIQEFIDKLVIGDTGFPFILNKEGYFIHHPMQELVTRKKNIFDLAKQIGNKKLIEIGKEIVSAKKGLANYFDPETRKNIFLQFIPLLNKQFSLVSTYKTQEILPSPKKERQLQFHIIIWIVLALLFFAIFLSCLNKKPYFNLIRFSVLSTLIFVGGIFSFWISFSLNTSRKSFSKGIPIISQITLDSFLYNIKQQIKRRNEKPLIVLPTGIFINSINFPNDTSIKISADTWQKYLKDIPTNEKELIIYPQATQLKEEKIHEKNNPKEKIINWNIDAVLAQKFEYKLYPFDIQRIKISMENPDLSKNIILTPDIDSYNSLKPSSLPGIMPNMKIADFHIKETFFDIELKDEPTNFGIAQAKQASHHYRLNYNIIIERGIINSLIIFLLPLLLILFILFAIFSITKSYRGKVYVSFSVEVGLLFALIILHRNLRASFPSAKLMYIEYLFFFSYVTMASTILYAMRLKLGFKNKTIPQHVIPILKKLYWPLQSAAWFIITFFVFY